MTTPTFNRFKSTTIYGNFNNVDYPDNSVLASAYFQRNLTISGDLTCSGIIYGEKLFYDNVDISSTFVSNLTLSSTLSNYALSSALTPYALSSSLSNYALSSSLSNYALSSSLSNYALSSSLSNYITSSALTPYALSSSLNNYALLSGATFTGTVNCNNGLTTAAGKDVHISCNNTFPTTNSGGKQGLGFFWNKSGGVGEVNLLTYGQGGTGGLSIWNSNVSNVPTKLVEFFPSGSVFTTTVNGITPAVVDDSTKFATTAFVKAQNYLSTASLSSYALLSGATFTGTVNCNNGLLNISQPSSTQSPILQFLNNLGQSRALIYPSVGDSVLRFSIIPNYGTNGFEWEKTGTTLMSLDSSGNLSIRGNLTSNTSSSIPLYSTITVPTTNTLDNFQGNYWTQYSVRPTNSVTTLNGVTTVNIGLQVPYAGSPPSTTQILISNTFYALGTVANPDTSQSTQYCVISPSYGATPTNTTNFFNINMYNVNGTLIRGYGTLLKSFSTNAYSIIFVATGGVVFTVNTPYTFDPFQFTYT